MNSRAFARDACRSRAARSRGRCRTALVEHLAGDVRPEAVRQVAAGVQGHAEQPLVAELAAQLLPVGVGELVDVLGAQLGQRGGLDAVGEDRPEGDEVGVDAGVRLDVGVLGAPNSSRACSAATRLDGVDVLAAGVEAVTDGALGVLVAEPGAHRQQHGRRGVVLAGDQLQRRPLVGQLLAGGGGDPRFDRADHLEDGVVGAGGGLGEGIVHGHRLGIGPAGGEEGRSVPDGLPPASFELDLEHRLARVAVAARANLEALRPALRMTRVQRQVLGVEVHGLVDERRRPSMSSAARWSGRRSSTAARLASGTRYFSSKRVARAATATASSRLTLRRVSKSATSGWKIGSSPSTAPSRTRLELTPGHRPASAVTGASTGAGPTAGRGSARPRGCVGDEVADAHHPPTPRLRCLSQWMCVSLHEIPVCGMAVQPLRLIDMTSVATPMFLVARRHVDLGRTRSAMCWPR